MVHLAEVAEQFDERIPERRDLLAAIADFNKNTLVTIERVYDFDAYNQDMKIVVSGAGTDGEFIRSCAWRLNQLLWTDEEKAKTLNNKLKSILDWSSGNVMFHVWCDVERLTATK